MASPSTVSTPLDLHLTISQHPNKNPSIYFHRSLRTPIKKRFTALCTNSSVESHQTPSLSDQLKPLSQTILSDNPNPEPHLLNKPKSIWVNPSKPRRSVLNLQRHKRPSYSYNPQLKDLREYCRRLNDVTPFSESKFLAILEENPQPLTRETALSILNYLKPWPKTVFFFNWLKTREDFIPMEAIFYNVIMKSLRFGKQFQLIEDLAYEMIEKRVELDNITYSTIITCAKRCELFDKAVEWFEKMYKTGLIPDEVTYSAVLDVYAKLKKVEEVLSLYERGRASGWKPDAVAFSILGKMFGEAGDYDGIRFVLQEMKSLEVEPNLVVYNTLLEAMGKAGKPGLARTLFEEMVESGVTPNEKTLTALIKIYGKARWGKDALELWERMKINEWKMDFMLYNALLSMCADLGLEEEAEELFEEMKGSKRCRPDSWSYTAMLNIHGRGGKVDSAMELFGEMRERGVKLNVMGCTCLIQCLGRAKRVEELVKVFKYAVERGVQPDDRLCGCLLSVVKLCESDEEVAMVLGCMEKCNPKLDAFVKMLGDEEVHFDRIKEEFKAILNKAAVEVRRPYCNCLIDICRSKNLHERGHELLYLGTLYGLYPGLHSKTAEEWTLNLRSLSVGAAHTAFEEWMGTLTKIMHQKEELPEVFAAYTGAGTHKFSQGLAQSLDSHLKRLGVPFKRSEEKAGCFTATREELLSWVQQSSVRPTALVRVVLPYCNCLIDICRSKNLHERGHELLYLGTLYGLYPGLHSKTAEEWTLNLRSLSVGAAHTAFEEWMGTLTKIMHQKEELPEVFAAYTGAGTHKFSQGLAQSLDSHLKRLGVPFKRSEEKAGCFTATREELLSWVQQSSVRPTALVQ